MFRRFCHRKNVLEKNKKHFFSKKNVEQFFCEKLQLAFAVLQMQTMLVKSQTPFMALQMLFATW